METAKAGSRFFQNRNCEHFPCHAGVPEEEFNCLFCYCPLYALGRDCGGNYVYTEKNIKSCKNCTFPHEPQNYGNIISRFGEIKAVVRRSDADSCNGQPSRCEDVMAETAVQAEARRRWDSVAKPLHSLGLLEDLVVKIAGVQETPDVNIDKRCAVVFCGDHGVVRKGVSQTGSEVTALVAKSIAEGTGNINLMASAANVDVFAVDMGMLTAVPGTVNRRVGSGTADITEGPAMTREQAEQAVRAGMDVMRELRDKGYRIAVIGEMGIGNTTAASAVTAALLGLPPEKVTGRGAGLSDTGLERKIAAITEAIRINRPDPDDPIDILAKLGGFELAGMAGAYLGGLEYHIPAIPDGMIPAASALIAARIRPETAGSIIPALVSKEPADQLIMEALGMEPAIRAQTALGEGTGGILLLPMLDMALRVYRGSHTFDALGMDAYVPQDQEPAAGGAL